jgi:hypothetical protein
MTAQRAPVQAGGKLQDRLAGVREAGTAEGSYNTNGEGGAVLVLLKNRATGTMLIVGSVHFYFDFRLT